MKFSNFTSIFKDLFKKRLTMGDVSSFTEACRYNNLAVVKDILLKKKPKHFNLASFDSFFHACEKGNLPIIEYLLTAPEAQDFHELHIKNSQPLVLAAMKGHTDIVKFLLASPKLKNHTDPHIKDDEIFTVLSMSDSRHSEIIKFLIFDMNIERTENIDKRMQLIHNKGLEELFKERDIRNNYNQLSIDLNNNPTVTQKSTKKLKI